MTGAATGVSTTGVWAGEEPREATSRGATLATDHDGILPLPLMSTRADGGTRWACDALGFATQLLPELPADIGPTGWRLLGGRAATGARTLDARREQSRMEQTLDALAEYAESSGVEVLVSVPGPWTLVRRLGLPDESSVLRDAGARRDVVQSYAFGLLELREKVARIVDDGTAEDPVERVRIRLVETDLDAILTGTVPTVSGYRTLPAVPDAHVIAALWSVVERTGAHTILSLPHAGTVRIDGKDIPHTQLARDAGIAHVAVPVTGPGGIGRWERLAEWADSGSHLWFRVPAEAATAPEAVATWVDRVAVGWTAVGMARSGLADFGILTAEELPIGTHPLLPVSAGLPHSRAHMQMAGALGRAFADQAD